MIVTGLTRARFCELAGPARFGEAQPDRLFTLGLFSVIDALMDAPMADVLAKVPFPQDMTDALVNGAAAPRASCSTPPSPASAASSRAATSLQIQLEAMAWATEAAEQLFENAPAAAAA